MNLYRTTPGQNFLLLLTEFIIENFSSKLDKLKVVVPSGVFAHNLQKSILSKLNLSFLPEIFNYDKVISSGEEIFQIPSSTIDVISSLEEKILLAEIIKSYNKLHYNNLQSLKFAPLLGSLFNQLNLNNIKVEDISNLPTLSQAEHWKFIYEFLRYAYCEWQEKLRNLNKASKAEFLKAILNSEKDRLNNPNNFTIIAGLIGRDYTSWQFIKSISSNKNGYIFLPPLPQFDNSNINLLTQTKEELNNLYCLQKLLSTIGKKFTDFKPYGCYYRYNKILDNVILPKIINKNLINKQKSVNNIEYIECSDILIESQLISLICKANEGKKIAIVMANLKCRNYYHLYLQKNNIIFKDQLGEDIIDSNISQFIINYAELVCTEFSLKNLFIFLKNPILFCPNVNQLEKLLQKNNRFVETISQITKIVQYSLDKELILWWDKLFFEFSYLIDRFKLLTINNFSDTLKAIISSLEKIHPLIWQENDKFIDEVNTFIIEVLECGVHPTYDNITEFPIIFKSLIKSAKKYELTDSNYNIFLCLPKEAAYLNFDIVILTDFNENSWPQQEEVNPWLNNEMQTTLEFYPEHIKSSEHLYHFYLLLQNPKIFITRSKRQGANILLTSSYIRLLQYLLPIKNQQLNNFHLMNNSDTSIENSKISINAASDINSSLSFPQVISVTDIEMLVRYPYSFFIKKILKLKKLESINSQAGILEYGSYLHLLIDNYNKAYEPLHLDKMRFFLELCEQQLNNSQIPSIIKKSWFIKTKALAKDYIKFDEDRRILYTIHTEITGRLSLSIAGKQIDIVGRVDRIEIDNEGNCTIIDFKTGTIPNIKEVNSGLSPQLLILALIALEGGFNLPVKRIKNLYYVKLGNSKPYLQITEFHPTIEELEKHKLALINLLEYYIINMDFSAKINLLKYNDYKHFSREF